MQEQPNEATLKAWLEKAQACLTDGAYAGAFEYCDKILKANKDYIPGLMMKARIFKVKEESKKAVGMYRQVLKRDPNHADAWFQVGYLLSQLNGKDPAVEEAYGNVIKLEPNNASALNNLGVYYEKASHLDKAAEFFSAACERQPKEELYIRNYLSVLKTQNNYGQVFIFCMKMLKSGNSNEMILKALQEFSNTVFALDKQDKEHTAALGRLEKTVQEQRGQLTAQQQRIEALEKAVMDLNGLILEQSKLREISSKADSSSSYGPGSPRFLALLTPALVSNSESKGKEEATKEVPAVPTPASPRPGANSSTTEN